MMETMNVMKQSMYTAVSMSFFFFKPQVVLMHMI